jgi:hypothetical protein
LILPADPDWTLWDAGVRKDRVRKFMGDALGWALGRQDASSASGCLDNVAEVVHGREAVGAPIVGDAQVCASGIYSRLENLQMVAP